VTIFLGAMMCGTRFNKGIVGERLLFKKRTSTIQAAMGYIFISIRTDAAVFKMARTRRL
jgi:hypothetical protein